MDELDKTIIKIVNKKVSEPSCYEDTIRNALKYEKNINQYNILKKVAIVILSVSTIGCVVLAAQISEKINSIFDKNIVDNQNNEYIQMLENEYKTIDDLSIKIDSILMDDFKIQLGINYLYTNPITSAESKILITDENNNIIFNNYDTQIDNYFESRFKRENRHKYGESIVNEEKPINDIENRKLIEFTTRYNSFYKNIESNNIKRKLELYTDLDLIKFPESKRIYIQIEDVVLRNGSELIRKSENIWKFEIELDKKFSNRKTSIYVQENMDYSKQDFTISQAELSNVLLKVKIKYIGKQDLNKVINTLDLSSIQIFDEKNNQYINAEMIEVLENNTIKVDYSINKKDTSDILKIKIGDFNEIKMIRQ